MRKAKGIAAIFAGLLLMFRAGAITVSADEGKGNNGNVKIHAVGTAVADNRNEPKVCDFYIDGFKFDKGQGGTWVIVGQAPTAGNAGRSGTWGPADKDGNWNTAPIAPRLADGHYKLTVNTGKGDGKHKVFWVECGTTANGQGNVPPANGGQQNNGSNGNSSGERSSVPTNSKSKAGGSKSGTGSKSKNGSKSGTNSTSKKGGTASNTNSVSKEGTSTTPVTPGTPVTPVTTVTTTPIVLAGNTTIPAGTTVTLPGGTTVATTTGPLGGTLPTGTTIPAGATLPVGTSITGPLPGAVLGFESAPNQAKGAVSPEVEQPTAVNGVQTSAVNGEQTSPVAGVTSLPSTSTITDNGIWGALGIMLTGIGAFLLRKPSRRLN